MDWIVFMKVRLAIVGSRSFRDYTLMCDTLKDYDISQIVSGGAVGADSLAERYAKEHNIKCLVIKPDWDAYGRRAGYLRNVTIVEKSDACVAFWDGESKGTKHTINLCNKYNKPIKVVQFTPIKVKRIYVS